MQLDDRLIGFLKKEAERLIIADTVDFNPQDASGGNYDDAYAMGVEDGRIAMAREILIDLGVPYRIPA
jgi:hypothetical protein